MIAGLGTEYPVVLFQQKVCHGQQRPLSLKSTVAVHDLRGAGAKGVSSVPCLGIEDRALQSVLIDSQVQPKAEVDPLREGNVAIGARQDSQRKKTNDHGLCRAEVSRSSVLLVNHKSHRSTNDRRKIIKRQGLCDVTILQTADTRKVLKTMSAKTDSQKKSQDCPGSVVWAK